MFLSIEAGLTRGDDPVVQAPAKRARVESSEKPEVDMEAAASPSGDPQYRAYVGRPCEWDLVAARQIALLLTAGLREDHRLIDVGCGSLRAGRILIPYLNPGYYFGVEPNSWLVEEGIRHELGHEIIRMKRPSFRYVDDFSLGAFGVNFDFALAHSVFSHTYPDLALTGFRGIAGALAPEGKLFATFVERESSAAGSGWLYPGLVPYTWEKMRSLIEQSGMAARRIDWAQPRQSWFVAALPEAESEIDDLARQIRLPRVGGGSL